MSNSNVIDFKTPKPRVQINDNVPSVVMPLVYRLSGLIRVTPNKGRAKWQKAPLIYTIDPNVKTSMHKAQIQSVPYLDPKQDSGWVVVRKHHTMDHLRGYTDSQYDRLMSKADFERISEVYSEPLGLFTIEHRAAPKNSPDCLLIYIVSNTPHPEATVYEQYKTIDSYRIYFPDGSDSKDPSILYPFLDKPNM